MCVRDSVKFQNVVATSRFILFANILEITIECTLKFVFSIPNSRCYLTREWKWRINKQQMKVILKWMKLKLICICLKLISLSFPLTNWKWSTDTFLRGVHPHECHISGQLSNRFCFLKLFLGNKKEIDMFPTKYLNSSTGKIYRYIYTRISIWYLDCMPLGQY